MARTDGTVTRSTSLLCSLASVLWIAAVGAAGRPAPQRRADAPRVDFEHQIRPIIESHCLECHSAEKRKGGLSLATYADALDGGRNGAVIRPGNSTGSLIVQRLLGRLDPQMPKDEDPLPAATIALVRRWIDQGARETPTSPPAPPPWDAPMALTRPAVPPVAWSRWSAPTDRFIAAYLSDRGAAEPSVVEDARFARRAYLDLWGLLPPPDALAAFLKATDADKREGLVRTLLSDNQKYAEHWISFWNDLLRNEDGVQLLLGDRSPQEHHHLAARVARRQPSLRSVREPVDQSAITGRSRWISDWRQLARRNERGRSRRGCRPRRTRRRSFSA